MQFYFPFLPMLALLFIGLKLTDFIDWSWWWVTAPLWAIPVFLLVALVTTFFSVFIRELFRGTRRR